MTEPKGALGTAPDVAPIGTGSAALKQAPAVAQAPAAVMHPGGFAPQGAYPGVSGGYPEIDLEQVPDDGSFNPLLDPNYTALQLALAVDDGALSGAALQGLWNLIVPLLRLRRPSAFLLHPLCSIVEALRLLPAERLVAVRRAPQLLACAAFALVRLSQQAVRERDRVRGKSDSANCCDAPSPRPWPVKNVFALFFRVTFGSLVCIRHRLGSFLIEACCQVGL